jgi:hypothetical protein
MIVEQQKGLQLLVKVKLSLRWLNSVAKIQK